MFEVNKKYKTSIGEVRLVIHVTSNGDVITIDEQELLHKYNKDGEAITGNGVLMPRTAWLTTVEIKEPVKYDTSIWFQGTPSANKSALDITDFLFGNIKWGNRPGPDRKEYRITVEEV